MSFIFLDAEKPTRRFFSSHLKTQDIRNIGMLLLFRNANIEWKTQIDTNAHTTYKMLEYNFLSNQCKTCTAVRHFVGDILLSSRIFYVDSWLFFRLFSCWLQKPLNHHGHGAVLLLTTFSVAFCVCVCVPFSFNAISSTIRSFLWILVEIFVATLLMYIY